MGVCRWSERERVGGRTREREQEQEREQDRERERERERDEGGSRDRRGHLLHKASPRQDLVPLLLKGASLQNSLRCAHSLIRLQLQYDGEHPPLLP